MSGSFSVQLITSAHAKIMPGRLNTGMLEHAHDVTFSYTITTAYRAPIRKTIKLVAAVTKLGIKV